MWAHDLLGIGTDADERAVKRAYAVLLKKTRPDEDPAGFQRLVEARDHALWWAKNGFVEDDEDEDGPDPVAGQIGARIQIAGRGSGRGQGAAGQRSQRCDEQQSAPTRGRARE